MSQFNKKANRFKAVITNLSGKAQNSMRANRKEGLPFENQINSLVNEDTTKNEKNNSQSKANKKLKGQMVSNKNKPQTVTMTKEEKSQNATDIEKNFFDKNWMLDYYEPNIEIDSSLSLIASQNTASKDNSKFKRLSNLKSENEKREQGKDLLKRTVETEKDQALMLEDVNSRQSTVGNDESETFVSDDFVRQKGLAQNTFFLICSRDHDNGKKSSTATFDRIFEAFFYRKICSLVPCYLIINVMKVARVLLKAIFPYIAGKQTSFALIVIFSTMLVFDIILLLVIVTNAKRINHKMITHKEFRLAYPVGLFLWDFIQTVVCNSISRNKMVLREQVNWEISSIYFANVLLPCTLQLSFALSMFYLVAHCVETIAISMIETDQAKEVIPHFWGYMCAFVLGYCTQMISNNSISRGYDESRRLFKRHNQEWTENIRQESLMKLFLPQTVAEALCREMNDADPLDDFIFFKKPYIHEYNEVSVLFSDIVEFTKLSASLQVNDFISLIDQLFLRFDALSHKYRLLRIAILGDCYECVCGTEKRTPNHAELTVRMGLAMINVCRNIHEHVHFVRKNWSIGIRVGINSGDIVGGVIGKRRWRFDIVGKNVTLANVMENTSLASRVHITEFTNERLHGLFPVEDGPVIPFRYDSNKGSVKTFFIRSEGDKKSDSAIAAETRKKGSDISRGKLSLNDSGMEEDKRQRSLKLNSEKFEAFSFMPIISKAYGKDNNDATSNRKTWHDIVKLPAGAVSPLSLKFHSPLLEKPYKQWVSKNTYITVYMTSIIFGIKLISCLRFQNAPSVVFVIGATFCGFLFYSTLFYMPDDFDGKSSRFWNRIRPLCTKGQCFSYMLIIVIVMSNLYEEFFMNMQFENLDFNMTDIANFDIHQHSFTITTVLFMHIVSLNASLRDEDILMAICVSIFCSSFMIQQNELAYDFLDIFDRTVFALSFTICYHQRNFENRRIFEWRWTIRNSLVKVEWKRKTNEKLVLNILPSHVADFFLTHVTGKVTYCKAHENVGVIFASINNTKEKLKNYSAAETVESLIFLHTVISEIDHLLDNPELESVTKIKTAGTLYMAASGLSDQIDETAEVSAVTLLEFGFAIIKLFSNINKRREELLNVRIGYSIGPVIAGVVCENRPHYDIWGHTVNIASRMESSGITGQIQVNTQTMTILQKISTYNLERRGHIDVKGLGRIATYFVFQKER